MKRIFTLVLLATVMHTYAQNTLRDIIKGEGGLSKNFVRLNPDQQTTFNQKGLSNLLNLDNNIGFVLINQQSDGLGFTHYRYYQTYKGIPIENSMYIVHTKDGYVTGFSGEIAIDFDATRAYSTTANIPVKQAIGLAVKRVAAREYMWQDNHMQQRLREQTRNANATYEPKADLVWFSDAQRINPRNLRLAYKVDVYAKLPLGRADHFVDAETGEYLRKKDKIYFSDATGTAATAYSGSQTIHSDYTGSNYRLRDNTKGHGIITLHGESTQRGADYTSSSANWTLTGTNQAALDAHYGVSQTYTFYKTVFGRNSYDGNGTALYSYVNDPTYLDNAFWDGSAMNFNERSTGEPGGVTGIDITGHELTHGVTQTTSGLNYSFESGAMNESMSDIMGKSVQFWSKPSDVNWQLSNDMNWIIRDMSNPNLKGQPDTYKGKYWYSGTIDNDNGGVHTNSGVGNFMFYLLVNGGSGTNDIGNGYTVNGLGLSKADQIIFRSETVYLVPSSNYADWRTACINSATDLYGAGSNEVVQVMNAWYAVGIGSAASGGCSVPTGLTASSITNTSATVSWSGVSTAVSYNLQWKASASSTWNTVSGLTTTSHTLTGLTLGTAYQFRVQTVCAAATSAYSSAASFTTTGGSITYCTSKGSSTTYEWIKQVTFGSINNASGDNNGYGNYTGLTANVTAGSTYTITLVPGFRTTAYKEYWTVYIDFNKNGTLNNSGEVVVTGYSTTGNKTANITIPATAKNGPTRMRIQMHYNSQVANPCSAFDYGEVEDYTLNISGGSGLTTVSSLTAADASATDLQKASIAVRTNPVIGSNATATYRLAQSGVTAIRLVDVAGRTLQNISLGNQNAGSHTYDLNNLSRLSAGNYLLVLEQNATVVARGRFVVVK